MMEAQLKYVDRGHVDIRDIYIAHEDNAEVIYYGNDGGVCKYIYQDNNSNLIDEYYNLNGNFLPCNNAVGLGVANSMNRNVVMQCTHQGSFNLYNEYMSIEDPGGDADDIVFHPTNEYICYKEGNGCLFKIDKTERINSQEIWSDLGYVVGEAYIGMKLVLNPNNPDILYFPSKKHHLGIYNDVTKEVVHKATISIGNDTLGRVGAIGVAANNDIYIAAWGGLAHGAATKLMVSHNAGNTWQDLSFGAVWEQQNNQWQESGTLSQLTPWRPIHGIVCNPQDSNELWISVGGVGQKDHLRVLHSTDGGSNWYDYSIGLSEFPITKMLYDYTTETLFAGTDAGVFYRQPFANNDTEWHCFSNGLPMGGTSDMEINHCTRELYISMNGRGVFHSPIPFPEINSGSGLTPEPGYIVTSDEIWDTPRLFTDNVIIMPHVSLTINAPCYFAENTGIKVKPTGILHVNALLTNQACGTMWNGIEAGGHTLLPSTLQYQAVVYINEGGRIQHAKTGVCNYLRDNNGVPIPLSYGGIIKAYKAAFVNNYIAFDIQRYAQGTDFVAKKGACDINQSKFWIDPGCYVLFDYEKQPPTFINIFDNAKVIVRNNNFTSGIINLTFLSQRRLPTVIRATNSAIQCVNNDMHRCEYGVYSLDYEPRVATDLIQNNRFHYCINGIYQHGTSGSCIVDNTLSQCIFLPPVYNYQTSKSIRMYLDKCNNYIVENNTFRGNFPIHKALQIGLVVNDGGPNDQIINNNDLQGFDYAILAQGSNRNATGSTGLSFKCNSLLLNRFDISVSALPGTPHAGIAALQGSNDNEPTAPAGNRFNSLKHYEGHFHNIPNNLGAVVTYYHHQTDELYWKRKLIPGYVDPTANLVIGVNVEKNDYQTWKNIAKHCPSIYSKDWAEKQSLLAGQQQIAQSSQTQLRLWTDQGDTPAMAQEIDNSSSDEAFALRNQLLNTSPYLSQEVLQKATAKEQVLNNALLRDVLVANPQAAKDQGVLQALGNRVQPMPESMEQQILAGQTRVGAKEALEATHHQAQGLYNNTLTAMQAGMQNDSSNTFTVDSLLQLLSHAHNIDSRYRLAALYQAQDNNADLQTVWQNMTADFQLSASQQQEAVDMQSYLSFLKQLRSETGSLPDSLQSDAQQALQNWHENSGNRVGALAQNALIATHAIDYTPPLILPDLENYSPQQAYTVGDKMAETPPEVRFEVYPNPAKDYIIADYKIEKTYSHASLQIVEVGTARLCQSIDLHTANNAKTIAVQGLSVGTYTIYLQIDGKKSLSYTFEIIK